MHRTPAGPPSREASSCAIAYREAPAPVVLSRHAFLCDNRANPSQHICLTSRGRGRGAVTRTTRRKEGSLMTHRRQFLKTALFAAIHPMFRGRARAGLGSSRSPNMPDSGALPLAVVEKAYAVRGRSTRHRPGVPHVPRSSAPCIRSSSPRGLNREQILSLGNCRFVGERHNLLITGPTGIGKSFLACAFVERACRRRFTGCYVRAPRLLHELAVARGDGSYARLLTKLAKLDLLAIDDWLLHPLKESERRI